MAADEAAITALRALLVKARTTSFPRLGITHLFLFRLNFARSIPRVIATAGCARAHVAARAVECGHAHVACAAADARARAGGGSRAGGRFGASTCTGTPLRITLDSGSVCLPVPADAQVLSRSALARFPSGGADVRRSQLRELSMLSIGIRLYKRSIGAGGADLDAAAGDALVDAVEARKRLDAAVADARTAAARLRRAIAYKARPRPSSASISPVTRVELANQKRRL